MTYEEYSIRAQINAQVNSMANSPAQAKLSNIQYRMQGDMLVATLPEYKVMNPVTSPTVLLLEDI